MHHFRLAFSVFWQAAVAAVVPGGVIYVAYRNRERLRSLAKRAATACQTAILRLKQKN